MAISNVPVINGPSFGGVIYGLNLQMGYSSAPSKLVIDIVNKDGNYDTPSLNSAVQISFGSFKFNGFIWSYNIKENSQEKTLQVEIIDKSILLDRYYVLLWKRGFFNDFGTKKTVEKNIELNDQVLIPIKLGLGNIQFQLKNLGTQKIEREVYSAGKINKNIIYLGTEDIPDTKCDIPDTYYTLDDLKKVLSPIIPNIKFSAPQDYRATHEGSLREVLQAWAEDCGVDFYWNYSTDQIEFYSIEKGISLNIPKDIKEDNLIEKNVSQSIEGTFSQQAFAYTAQPKGELAVRDFAYETSVELSINPFPISWFLKNNDTLQSLGLPQEEEGETEEVSSAAERNLWGGRTEEQFLQAAFLGYVDDNLRDLWSIYQNNFYVCGLSKPANVAPGQNPEQGTPSSVAPLPEKLNDEDKNIFLQIFREQARGDAEELEKISKNLENHDIYDVTKNDNLNSKWKQIEQEILQSYGSVYRHTIRGGFSYYCSPTLNTQIETTIDPEPDADEPNNDDFQGLKTMSRQGTFSHSQNKALELLGLLDNTNIENLSKLRIYDYDSKSFKLNEVLPNVKGTNLLIVPKRSLFTSLMGELNVEIADGLNRQEVTVDDIIKGQNESNSFNCNLFDDQLEKSKCTSLRDEALEKKYLELGIARTQTQDPKLFSGLKNRTAKTAKISLGKSNLTLAAPSDGRFATIANIRISAKKAYELEKQKIFFEGSAENADKVARIDVLIDNITNNEDNFMTKRSSKLPLAKSLIYDKPQEKCTLKFVGNPKGVSLDPLRGLSSIDISYSSEGFITTVEYSSRPPKRTNVSRFLDKIESQLNRKSFNSN